METDLSGFSFFTQLKMDIMKISKGLFKGQVLQRNRSGFADAMISGESSSPGDIQIRIFESSKILRDTNGETVGSSDGKTFTARITDIPSGGPFSVELRITRGSKIIKTTAVDDIYVGDVWFLAGQSNMEGLGNLVNASTPHPMVRAFYMRDEWDIAKDKLHFLPEAVDRVHNNYGTGPDRPSKASLEKVRNRIVKGASLAVAFGKEMYKRTKVPQGLVACAHGGTSMAQWSPSLQNKGGDSFYGAMMRRYKKLAQPIAGILWYQGESDANPDAASMYTNKMTELVDAARSDMNIPLLPWFMVQIGCHASQESPVSWNNIQEQERNLPDVITELDVVPSIDLELDDGIHIGADGQKTLGKRMARVADKMIHRAPGSKKSIRLKEIKIVPTPFCNIGAQCMSVEVSYSNVAGTLISDGRPAGFALLDHNGNNMRGIYKTTLKGSSVLLHTNMPRHQIELLSLSYGHGRQPICNITDKEDMSLPVMQSVMIDPDHARSLDNCESTCLNGITTSGLQNNECLQEKPLPGKVPRRELTRIR